LSYHIIMAHAARGLRCRHLLLLLQQLLDWLLVLTSAPLLLL
jgi:hypothetical protein